MSENEFAVAIQSGYEQGYKDGGIAELEKLKAELYGKVQPKEVYMKDGKIIFRSLVDEIIDNHIAELKG